jgi:2-amino-4-hydroxy-6-hydroxymethyldihydropteridine diphosphokinase
MVLLSLGSNLGDRVENLRRAIQAMKERGIEVVAVSRLYETEPVGVVNQPWFVNCAAEIRTSLAPPELLRELQAIEKSLGRVRDIPQGPRTIDLDILSYGDAVIDTPELTVPHPRMRSRRFVLEPLAEIAPGFGEMLAALPHDSEVRLFGEGL